MTNPASLLDDQLKVALKVAVQDLKDASVRSEDYSENWHESCFVWVYSVAEEMCKRGLDTKDLFYNA